MIQTTIFSAVDPGSQQISASFQFDLRYQFGADFLKSGVTGDPQVFVEVSNDDTNWIVLKNPTTGEDFTLLDQDAVGIERSNMPFKFLRFRMEDNGATGGTVSAVLSRKETN